MAEHDWAELRRLANELEGVEWRAADYSHEPAGAPGVACDAWETFVVNPGEVDERVARFVAAACPANVLRLIEERARWERRCEGGWTHPEDIASQLNRLREVARAAAAYAAFRPAEGSAGRHAAHRALLKALGADEGDHHDDDRRSEP